MRVNRDAKGGRCFSGGDGDAVHAESSRHARDAHLISCDDMRCAYDERRSPPQGFFLRLKQIL